VMLAVFKNIDPERVIHSVKTAFACIFGFFITRFVHLPQSQWIIISIVVVMCAQINVGSVLNKSYMRFLGTLAGSLLAGLTLVIFGNNPLAAIMMIAFAVLIFSYVATSDSKVSDSGTLGAVTVIIILIGQNPSVQTALDRFCEISLGILIAALVSQFVLPIRARDHLIRAQAKTISQLSEFYNVTLITTQNEITVARYLELDEEIAKALASQRTLAKQARREPLSGFDPIYFSSILRCEKEIFRSIVCTRYAYNMLPQKRNLISDLPVIKNFHQRICQTFADISAGISAKDFSAKEFSIPHLQPIKTALLEISAQMTVDERVYLNGFLFCTELLIVHLKELVFLLENVEKPAP
jgi:hypothetical protein